MNVAYDGKATYDSEGLPRCPDCGHGLYHESAGNRDLETMGGYSVEYFVCEHGSGCGQQFRVINGKISPSGDRE